MTRARRLAAVALGAALTVALAAQLSGNLDVHWSSRGRPQATGTIQPGPARTTEVASAVPTVDEQAVRLAAAQTLLAARAAAVRSRSRTAWMATVDLPSSPFGKRQALAFSNLIKLPLGQFAYDAAQLAPSLSPARARRLGPEAWAAAVSGSYTLAGFDRAPRPFDATYTFVQRAGRWRIADDTDGATAAQIWDLSGLRVLRGRSAIVIGNAPEPRMRVYRTVADAAVRRVAGVWGTDWNTHVVIVTPSTSSEFAALLLRASDAGLDQVAAITQGVIELGKRAEGDRVVINPKAFAALEANGRRVVLTHELTHVAARSSTTRPVPIWLSEGMADYIGYSGLGLPRARVAAELLTLVRHGKGPTALPVAADFDPSRTKIAPFYSASWLAVSRLADLYGQGRVVSFYRAVAGRLTVSPAVELDPDAIAAQGFSKAFGITEPKFVAGWRGYLKTLALTRG